MAVMFSGSDSSNLSTSDIEAPSSIWTCLIGDRISCQNSWRRSCPCDICIIPPPPAAAAAAGTDPSDSCVSVIGHASGSGSLFTHTDNTRRRDATQPRPTCSSFTDLRCNSYHLPLTDRPRRHGLHARRVCRRPAAVLLINAARPRSPGPRPVRPRPRSVTDGGRRGSTTNSRVGSGPGR